MTAMSSRETTRFITAPVRQKCRARCGSPAPLLWATMVEMADPRLMMGSSIMVSTR